MSKPRDEPTTIDSKQTKQSFAQRYLTRTKIDFLVASDYKMLNNGITALISQRFSEAEMHFREAFETRKSADAAFYLGHALHRQAKWAEAYRYYEMVHASDLTCCDEPRECFAFPEPPSLRLGIDRGRVLLMLGRTADAIISFREALKKHPTSAALKLGLSSALYRSGMDALNSSALLKICEEPCRMRHQAAAYELPKMMDLDLGRLDVGIATDDAKSLEQVADADLYFLQAGPGQF